MAMNMRFLSLILAGDCPAISFQHDDVLRCHATVTGRIGAGLALDAGARGGRKIS
jgi:hypothetical protein